MDYRHRLVENKLLELVQYHPVVIIIGARQVGKSTLIQHLFAATHKTIVFDPVQDIGGARQDPDLFLQNYPAPLFLDEIQYAPELTASIKRKVDREKQNGAYILSSSQNLSILKTISESLSGRAAVLNLYSMSWSEISAVPSNTSYFSQLLQQNQNIPSNIHSPLSDSSHLARRLSRTIGFS